MAKPASGATLDSGGSLYSQLTAAGSAVWAMLEGSGGTSADSSGNGHTLTLAAWATWGTNGGGEAIINCAASSGQTLAITSPIHIASTTSWSLAFRLAGAAAGINASFGRASSSNSTVFWAYDTNFGYYVNPISGNNIVLSGATDWHTDANWLLVVDAPGLKIQLYRNGSEVSGSPYTITGPDTEFYFVALGSGYDASGVNALIGSMTYAYLMNGYAASSSDATALNANPYSIFSTGGGSIIPLASYYNQLLRV